MKEIFDSSWFTALRCKFFYPARWSISGVTAGNESYNAIPDIFLDGRRKGFLPASSFFTIHLITWPLYDGAEKSAVQVKLTPGKIFSGKGILGEGKGERTKPAVPRAKYQRRTMDTLFRLFHRLQRDIYFSLILFLDTCVHSLESSTLMYRVLRMTESCA